MRKVGIVSMNVTLDGFMAAKDCGLDWHFRSWNEEMARANGGATWQGRYHYTGWHIPSRSMAQYWNSDPVNMVRPREDLDFLPQC